MRLEPFGNTYIVKPPVAIDGTLLPVMGIDAGILVHGTVVEIGIAANDGNVRVGDVVFFQDYTHFPFKVDGTGVLLVRAENVVSFVPASKVNAVGVIK